MVNQSFKLGNFVVLPLSNEIRKGTSIIRIEPKIMRTLCFLVQNYNSTVSRDALMEEVWEKQIVSDAVLSRNISELRKVFKADPGKMKYIQTIPKRGYKLVVEPKFLEEEPSLSTKTNPRFSKATGLFLGLVFIVALTFYFLFLFKPSARNQGIDLASKIYQPLIASETNKTNISISPDGKNFAFIENNKGQIDIYYSRFKDPDETMALTHNGITKKGVAWSPDGKQIAFIQSGKDSSEIVITDLDTKKKNRLLGIASSQVTDLDWSPDGQWLIYSYRKTALDFYNICLLSVKTGESTMIAPEDNDEDSRYPKFSPSGRFIAVKKSSAEGIHDVHIIDFNTLKTIQQTNFKAPVAGLDWGENDNTVIFSGSLFGTYSLWLYSIQEHSIHLLKQGSNLIRPAFSKTKNILAFENWVYDANIHKISINKNTTENSKIIHSVKNDYFPVLSQDKKKLAYISSQSGFPEIWISAADGSSKRRITSLESNYISAPRWSSDDTELVFSSSLGGSSDIYRVNITTKEIIPVFEGESEDRAPFWSENGAWIYFSQYKNGQWNIWKVRSNGEEAEQLKIPEAIEFIPAIGHHRKYYVTLSNKTGKLELIIRQPDHTPLKTINISGYNITNWSLSGLDLYYLETTPQQHKIYRFNILTNSQELITNFANDGSVFFGLDFSPLDSSLYIGVLERVHSDLMVMN